MAGFQPLRRRVGVLDDADPTDDWMAGRNAWVAARDEAEAAGREAWAGTTNGSSPVPGATRDALIQLGATARAGPGSKPTRTSLPDFEETPSSVERIRLVEPDGTLATPPNLRFVTARAGDSISKLVGTTDPRAIGRFLTLNGLDGRRSDLAAGRDYAVPTDYSDVSGDERVTGARLLHADNARLDRVRAERARRQAS